MLRCLRESLVVRVADFELAGDEKVRPMSALPAPGCCQNEQKELARKQSHDSIERLWTTLSRLWTVMATYSFVFQSKAN